ncbi:MAG: hypothetical protein CNE95_07055 [Puniceicoccaceae bacterium MED-G30]|nr:MAG: hypothetical protein CNE95_07055 [Puniceicoccaceae bacterium MED-G30]RPG83404.1 MAG: TonB family protein [Coraliomargarita sp. TMED73]|tara:strand:+ start:18253 stop:18978 length:726 start_codon:yes stop_codon:yes gene_type:complete
MKGLVGQPFWTSVILHFAVLALLLLAVLFEAFRPKPKRHIFEMLSPPEASRVNMETSNPRPQPMPELPQIDPMPKLPEARVLPQPAPETTVTTEPPPVINYEQFVREHGKPKPRKPSTSQVIPQPSVPVISAPRLEIPTNSTASNQPTAQELSELQRYSAQLNSRLKNAWRTPNMGGVQVSVNVVFDVTATGQIINLQLQPASGQFTFDQSIRDVFRKVANAGPTPTGRRHRFSMSFQNTR